MLRGPPSGHAGPARHRCRGGPQSRCRGPRRRIRHRRAARAPRRPASRSTATRGQRLVAARRPRSAPGPARDASTPRPSPPGADGTRRHAVGPDVPCEPRAPRIIGASRAGVAVLVREAQVVETPNGAGPDRVLRGAVAREPVSQVLVVQRVRAAEQHAVHEEAKRTSDGEVDADPEAAALVVGLPARTGPPPAPKAPQTPQQRLPVTPGVRRVHELLHAASVGAVRIRRLGLRQAAALSQVTAFDPTRSGVMQAEQRGPAAGGRRRDTGAPTPVVEQAVGVAQQVDDVLPHRGFVTRAGLAGGSGERDGPAPPLFADELTQGRAVLGPERALHRRERMVVGALELRVRLTQQPAGVAVATEPDVQPVLLDALAAGGVSAAGPFTAEPPAELVQRDLEPLAPSRLARQLPGGGTSTHAAAWELTRQPDWRERFEITEYQLGWRLGGKGASSRNPARGERIEEHGLHVWFGCYRNACRLLREAYAELERPDDHPLATVERAFRPQDRTPLGEFVGKEWRCWPVTFPRSAGEPGTGDEATVWQNIVNLLRHADRLFDDWCRRAGVAPPAPGRWASLFRLHHPAAGRVEGGYLRQCRRLAEAEAANPDRPYGRGVKKLVDAAHTWRHRQALLWRLQRFRRWGGARAREETDDERRRLWIGIDLAVTAALGFLVDGVLFCGTDALDDEDLRDWLARHGASKDTIWSGAVRGLYDLCFAYENGDAGSGRPDDPGRPRFTWHVRSDCVATSTIRSGW